MPKIDWIEKKELNIPYGPDSLQRFDLYYPNGAEDRPLPVVIIVHGGGFVHMDKADWHLYPGFYALREGFALISINYRLAPKHPYPAAVRDVEAAVAHIRERAGALGLDGDNLFLYGTSAGGNLVSITGLRGVEGIRGVAALCPLVDFEWFFLTLKDWPLLSPNRILFRQAMRKYLGGRRAEAGGNIREASATHYIGEKILPMYIQHGTADPGVPVDQATRFHEALVPAAEAGGTELVLDLLEGAGHAGGGPDFLEERNILPILQFFRRQIVPEQERVR